MENSVYVCLFDADSGEELDVPGFNATVIPRAGERIHFWQDGFPDQASTDSGIRSDFDVIRVEHDWRWMAHGSARMVPSVMLHVRTALKEASSHAD